MCLITFASGRYMRNITESASRISEMPEALSNSRTTSRAPSSVPACCLPKAGSATLET